MIPGTDAVRAPLPGAAADISAGAVTRGGPGRTTASMRYATKRQAVIAAATEILNKRGVKGMTLAEVAGSVGLITTSVTYYFKRKEDLAAACFLSGIARYDALIGEALREPTPQARLHRFLTLYLELKARIRMEGEAAIPAFNDVRALTEPRLTQVRSAYADVFRRVRGLFDAEGFAWMEKRMSTARTHMIMEQLFWAVAWLSRYEVEDYPRIRVSATECSIF